MKALKFHVYLSKRVCMCVIALTFDCLKLRVVKLPHATELPTLQFLANPMLNLS